MKKIVAWLLCAALFFALMAGCGGKAEEVPELPEETAAGKLVSFDGETLLLDGAQGEHSFVLDETVSLALARGFVSGDDVTVRYQGEQVLSVSSEKANTEEAFALRGTVSAISADMLKLKSDEGDTYSFLIAGAALDLWQGLSKGIYVEVCGVGDPDGDSAALWVQSVCDHADGELLAPAAEEEAAAEVPAEGEEIPAGEAPAEEAPAEEAPAEEVPAEEELPWELTDVADEVWAAAAINLRLGPGMDHIRIAQVDGGQKMQRIGTTADGWSCVVYNGQEGYVSDQYLLLELPEQTYTVSFDAGEGVGAPAAQYKIHGQDMPLSETVPVRAGYTFLGWNTSENGFGITMQPGDLLEMNDTVTLYAQWKEGEPEPTPAPTPDPAAEEEPAEEPAEPSPTPEPKAIADTSSALSGVIGALEEDEIVLDLEGELYIFDISGAAITAERGLHAGDAVTVYYAGTIGDGKDCSRAPAVCVAAEAGNAVIEGVVAGLTANVATVEVDGQRMYVAADTQGLALGAEVTVTLKSEVPEGNLFAAAKIA